MVNSSFIFRSSLAAGALLALTGCLPRGTDLGSLYAPSRVSPDAPVTYAVLRDQLLAPRCLGCHSEFNSEDGLAADVVAGDPAHSPLYQRIADGSMPPGGPPVASGTLQLVERYITGLAPAARAAVPQEPAPAASPAPQAPAPEMVDFARIRSAVLAPRCLKCHQDMGTEAGLKPYVEPGKPEVSKLFREVENGDMPPRGGPLPASDQELIKSYIAGLKTDG